MTAAGERLQSYLVRAVDALARGDELEAVRLARLALKPFAESEYLIEQRRDEGPTEGS